MVLFIAFGLGLLGLFLIYLEFFVPGGVLGILGGVFIGIGFVLLLMKNLPFWIILTYIFGLVFLLIFVIRFALWRIRSSKNALYSGQDQAGYVASSYAKHLIGKSGEALSDLKPSGHILVDRQPYQAVSESGYIKKGVSVKVVGGEGARLIVRKEEKLQ